MRVIRKSTSSAVRWSHHPIVGSDGVALLIGLRQKCIGIVNKGSLLPRA
jgi:hypothetical protein